MIMNENDDKFPEFITFPRTFEKYKWYKPLLVLVIGAIVYLVLQTLIFAIFSHRRYIAHTVRVSQPIIQETLDIIDTKWYDMQARKINT